MPASCRGQGHKNKGVYDGDRSQRAVKDKCDWVRGDVELRQRPLLLEPLFREPHEWTRYQKQSFFFKGGGAGRVYYEQWMDVATSHSPHGHASPQGPAAPTMQERLTYSPYTQVFNLVQVSRKGEVIGVHAD